MIFGKLSHNDEIVHLKSKVILIGRSPSSQILVNHRSISKEHALIDFFEKNQAFIKDLNSLNGTYLNNQKLATGSSSELKENDKISFGKEGSIYTFNYSFSNLQNHEVKHIKDPNIFVSETYKADESNSTAEFRKKEESVEDEEDVIIQKKELKFLQETLFFKEEQIQNKDKQIEFLSNEENSLKEELEKSLAKQKALELYASDLQRKLDSIQIGFEEKTKIIKELTQKDWIKTIQLNDQEMNALRKVIFFKDQEIEEVKRQYKSVFLNNRNNNNNVSEKILDQQINELLNAKKQLVQYENNSLECNKRWKILIQENLQKEEKLKGFSMQIDRQIENFKKIYSQFDQKIKEQNQKFLALIDRKETEFEAGKFLVEQMTIIQDEKMDLLVENERLQKQIELIIWQNQESQAALDNYQEFFKLDDEKTQTIVRLKEKIDELEDFIEEIKEKDGIPKLIQLNDLIEALEKKIVEKDEYIETLKLNPIKKSNTEINYIDEENAIDFFSKLLQDKDKKISYMEKEIEIYQVKKQQLKKLEIGKNKDESFSKKNEQEIFKEKNIKNLTPYCKNETIQRQKINFSPQDYNEITLMSENII